MQPAGEDQKDRGEGQKGDAQGEMADLQGAHVQEHGRHFQGQHADHDDKKVWSRAGRLMNQAAARPRRDGPQQPRQRHAVGRQVGEKALGHYVGAGIPQGRAQAQQQP